MEHMQGKILNENLRKSEIPVKIKCLKACFRP